MWRPMEDAAYWHVHCDLFNLFSYKTQDHQPGVVPPTIIQLLRKYPTGLPIAWPYGGIFSIEVPSSQMTLACLKFDIKTNHPTS